MIALVKALQQADGATEEDHVGEIDKIAVGITNEIADFENRLASHVYTADGERIVIYRINRYIYTHEKC